MFQNSLAQSIFILFATLSFVWAGMYDTKFEVAHDTSKNIAVGTTLKDLAGRTTWTTAPVEIRIVVEALARSEGIVSKIIIIQVSFCKLSFSLLCVDLWRCMLPRFCSSQRLATICVRRPWSRYFLIGCLCWLVLFVSWGRSIVVTVRD